MSLTETQNDQHTIEDETASMQLPAFLDKTDSDFEDIVLTLEEETQIKDIEETREPSVDEQLLNQVQYNDEDDDYGEREFSRVTANLQSIVTYEEFEKRHTSRISGSESFDIWTSSDTSEPEISSLKESRGRPVMNNATFLRTFKNIVQIPSITDVSLPSTRAPSIAIEKPEDEPKELVDPGQFVNPLTGEPLTVYEEDEKSLEQDSTSLKTSSSIESELIWEISEDEDILILTQELDERNRVLIPEEKDEHLAEKEMDAFLEDLANAPTEDLKMRLTEFLIQQHAQENTHKVIVEFLDDLIERVVDFSEYVDPQTVLRKNLDKSKLLDTFMQLVFNLRGEQQLSTLLNRKVAEHFRRKKAYRNITENNLYQIKEEMRKYNHQMENLDTYLGYENNAIETKRLLEEKLQNQLQQLNDSVQEEIEKFEGLVRHTFIRPETSERHVSIINTLLRRMRNQRNEVKEYRRELIYKQSLIAELNLELNKLEQLGEGLHLSEYNNKLTETIGITKLLDEKEFLTSGMRKRCHDTLHTVTHMTENISMQKSLMSILENEQNRAEQKKIALRQELYQLKLEHLRLMEASKQLHYQDGLISKKSILLDYDNILAKIPNARKRIQNLKSVHDNLTEKVKMLAKKCGGTL